MPSDSHPRRPFALAFARAAVILLAFEPVATFAGGPKYIAGVSYFNSSVLGQPVRWANGQVNYYVDQGPLNASVTNQQATAMVDAAAALWSAVPTAGVTLTDKGRLQEDVSGSNVMPGPNSRIAQPADVAPSATNYPVGVVYDADGSVIDSLFGAGASQPDSCQNSGVWVWIDNFTPDAVIAHAVIVLNGRCATTSALLQMMCFELERAFGRILGLDYSQVNPGALTGVNPAAAAALPIMQPLSGACGSTGGNCIPNPSTLSYDDIAALNSLYPITAANLASFPGKQLTAANTVSIQGTIRFRSGYGMQGVNVVARPLDSSGNPLYQYTVTAVSGASFTGNHGNPVTGFADASGNRLDMWGSNDPSQQGSFDLRGIPLPPGFTSADYQVTFEPVNPLYIYGDSVDPYLQGQVTPSGTLAAQTVRGLSAGSVQILDITASDSAAGDSQDAAGSASAPRFMPAGGFWIGRLNQISQTDWFTFPVRGGRTFTVVTQTLNEAGVPSNSKAMPVIGAWDAFDPVTAAPVGYAPGLNGGAAGETWLQIATASDDQIRIAIADQRGDGRPDFAYHGWVLYADTVQPARLPGSGGPIVIRGMGFRPYDTVLVGGKPATVTSISPNEITAIAPAAAAGVTGSVNVEVDDLPIFNASAIISGGISYNAGTGDALTLVTAPSNTVPIATPLPFTVAALGPDLAPAGGITVTYTVTGGTAQLACGQPSCSVSASGDGLATMNVIAMDATPSVVTASLSNGSSVQAHFSGGTPPVLTALTPQLFVAAGATFPWTVQAQVLNNGVPAGGQSVAWQTGATGISTQGSSTATTNAAGLAANTLIVGPLAEGQTATIQACLNGTSQCVTFSAFGARPEYAQLRPVSGVSQSLSVSGTPAQIVLRLLDMNGNPMAAGTVALYQVLYAWAPPCPPHGVCAPSELLAAQQSTAVSAVDGSIVFIPASLPGTPTLLRGLAATGNTSAVNIAVEQHP
ncbi:MAG TPA: IPT/TIG domain-containing protein [Terracidiphilus sp.]|nr:IPT/TIG domain-containing protein [Terracidiphilus sp.]